jgi:hypothetical protein
MERGWGEVWVLQVEGMQLRRRKRKRSGRKRKRKRERKREITMSIPSWKIRCKILVIRLSFSSFCLSLSFFQSSVFSVSISVSLCHIETLSFPLSVSERGRKGV